MKKTFVLGLVILYLALSVYASHSAFCEGTKEVAVCYYRERGIGIFDNPAKAKIFQNELSSMDKRFVDAFNNRIEHANEQEINKIQKNVEEYLELVRQNKTVSLKLDDKTIEKLLDGKIDLSKLQFG